MSALHMYQLEFEVCVIVHCMLTEMASTQRLHFLQLLSVAQCIGAGFHLSEPEGLLKTVTSSALLVHMELLTPGSKAMAQGTQN